MKKKKDYLSLQKPAKLKLPELLGRFPRKIVFFDTKFRSNLNGFSSVRLPAKLSSSLVSYAATSGSAFFLQTHNETLQNALFLVQTWVQVQLSHVPKPTTQTGEIVQG